MLDFLSNLVIKHPRKILIFWLLMFLISLPFVGRIGEVLTNDFGAAPDSQAKRVTSILNESFEGQDNYQIILVAEGEKATPASLNSDFKSLLADLSMLTSITTIHTDETQELIPAFESEELSSLAILELSTDDRLEALAIIEEIKPLIPADGQLSYYLTGGIAIEAELGEISKSDMWRAELIGLSISLVVLIIVFGALLAASLPLLVAILSIALSLASLFFLGQFHPVANFAQTIVSLLGLATGIDYALLMVNRYREELSRGVSARQAAKRTTQTAGKAVAVSGLTVLVALSALLIPPLAFIRSMGISSIVVMFFSVSISITALPALLGLLGHRVNWLKITRREPGSRTRSFWRGRAEKIMRRPWAWTSFGMVLLLIMSVPALSMQVDVAGVRGLDEDTNARQAQRVLESLKLDGLERSFDVLIDFGEQGFYHPKSVRSMAKLSRQISSYENTEKIFSPTTANVPSLLMYQYYASKETALQSPLADLVRASVSQDGRYGFLRIFPKSHMKPKQISVFITELEASTNELGLNAIIGGNYVLDREWSKTLFQSFPLAIGFVYLATFILLSLAFNSILIPIKSIILNTLTVGVSFGVITTVFQHGWLAPLFGLSQGLGFVETSVPIFIFAIVFGLSMDYEVFLVSRIVEGHKKGMDDRQAVLHALGTTGNVITSAALIMVIVFSVFIFSDLVLIKTLSLGLSIAILLDATLVRSTLVPAMMLLMGNLNWWMPKPFAKLAKRVNLGHD